ncbi:chorismate-binding protein [Pontibacter russatus]|uniref:chorismate-binding protein n=1 Tax=Pontibacter russatus TaxID=2694929 RepID=UPI00137A879E|nr:chorismate-binding protein [Pontibacter russatus]
MYRTAIAKQYSMAMWCLPETGELQACISLQPNMVVPKPDLEQSPFGFLFCPFAPQGPHQNLFIKADLFYTAETGKLTAAPDVPVQEYESFRAALKVPHPNSWHISGPAFLHAYQQEDCFTSGVAKAVQAIRAGEMEKVVLSRDYLEQLPSDFSPVAALEAMQQAYPRVFVSLVSIPGVGTWMGASPEILVSVNEEKVFHTVALAGTQPAVAGESVASAIWRQKEIEEQAMVERYILKCFKTLRLRDYTEVGPRTIIAGNLMHLRTDFKVDLKEVDFPTLASDMLALLHPTSAVCGLPKEPALQFILENEGFDRSYYSGFLGPVNSATGTHLYVNLRCMELLEEEAILYAGAGITAESNPQKEWQETQHKMQTMRRILAQF